MILHYLKNNLASYLQEFKKKEGKKAYEALDNFKLLLKMWKKYYHFRQKDCNSLVFSSTIDFNIWNKVADLLLTQDDKEPCSLFFNDKNKI
jgi:hypothetical protein